MIAASTVFSLNATLVAELVVFGLVVAVIAKVMAPALRRAMAERQRTIDEGLAVATSATERLAHADAEHRRIVGDARREAADLLASYRRMAADTEADALRRARAHRVRVIVQTRREAEARLAAADERAAAGR